MAAQLGYREVYRYPSGILEWQANGLAVARPEARDERPASPPWASRGLGWALAGVFLGGIALNLTPCVYPLLPVTVSYFAGRGGGRAGALTHGACYVAGLALTNATLGVAAALSGGLLGSALRNPVVPAAVAAVQLALAASLFGFWELRVPSFLTRPAARSFAGHLGSVFMGMTMGVVAAPCIGPFVLGLLTWVALSGSAALGFAVFFSLSLGLGLPLFLLALAGVGLDWLPLPAAWMVWVRRLMGWVLVGMAVHFVRPLLPPDAGLLLLAAAALAAGVDLGWRSASEGGSRLFSLLRLAAGVCGVLLALTLVVDRLHRGPGVRWRSYSDELLAAARREGKTVLIDFTASWCTPCDRLDDETFRDPRVVDLATEGFTMVKVDLTGSGDPLAERLVREYAVRGVPTVVFVDPSGRERTALRLHDFLPADDLLARMQAARVTM